MKLAAWWSMSSIECMCKDTIHFNMAGYKTSWVKFAKVGSRTEFIGMV